MPPDAHGAGRLQERNVRHVQGGAGADHGQDVGVVLPVGRQDRGHDLHFAEVVGGEEGPNGPIDETTGQDFLGGRSAFALDEAARKLAGGVGLFAIIDAGGERNRDSRQPPPRRRRPGSPCRRTGRRRRHAPAWPTCRFRCLVSDRQTHVQHDMPARDVPLLCRNRQGDAGRGKAVSCLSPVVKKQKNRQVFDDWQLATGKSLLAQTEATDDREIAATVPVAKIGQQA